MSPNDADGMGSVRSGSALFTQACLSENFTVVFGFEDRIWDLIVSVPDHCLSFYLSIVIFQAHCLSVFRNPLFKHRY